MCSLLSVSQFARNNNVYFVFYPNSCFVKDQVNHEVLLEGKLRAGLYQFDTSHAQAATLLQPINHSPLSANNATSLVSNPGSCDNNCTNSHVQSVAACDSNVANAVVSNVFDLWHNRLGQPSSSIVKSVMQQCNVSGINKMGLSFCPSRCFGQIHKFSFPTLSLIEYTSPLQLVHTDRWGPAPYVSSIGYRYYISFIDTCTCYTWLYLLRNKSDAFKTFLNFKNQVELQLGYKIQGLQSDWSGEYRDWNSSSSILS